MKSIFTFFIALLASLPTIYAQEYEMADITYRACSGIFTDSQGTMGNYTANETFTTTICSPFTSDKMQVSFTQFDLAPGDVLIAYDGDSPSSPLIGVFGSFLSPSVIEGSLTNTSGCLTFVFTSNPSSLGGAGWTAGIVCANDCQTITSSVTTIPAPSADGIIRICQGDTVDIVGNPNFSMSMELDQLQHLRCLTIRS